jgi:hypothetical protein
MTEGNPDGSADVGLDGNADRASADGHSADGHSVAPEMVATPHVAPTAEAKPLDFSRDGDHPEKPDQFEPAPAPKPAEVPKPQEPKTEVEAPKPRRADPVASAPVLERVVVSIDGTPAATPAAPADEKPVRKGWWQRKLAGE